MSLLHTVRPFEETDQFRSMFPDKLTELRRRNFIGVQPPVGFDAPAKVWTAPGLQAVPGHGTPQEADHCLVLAGFAGAATGVLGAAAAGLGAACAASFA